MVLTPMMYHSEAKGRAHGHGHDALLGLIAFRLIRNFCLQHHVQLAFA